MKALKLSKLKLPEFYIDLRRSKLLLREFVERYNTGRPLRERLRPSHVALVVEMLEIYRVVVWKAPPLAPPRRRGGLLPSLKTNNVQLSRRLGCSERSIQHWRRRLKVAGVILEEIWHGSNASYEVRLNPAVIYLARQGVKGNLVDGVDEVNGVNGLRGSGCGLEAFKVWKTGGFGVEMGAERLSERGEGTTSYGEKNMVFAENFSPYCTLSFLDTNQLNQLEVGKCGNGAGVDDDRSLGQRRSFLTGYEFSAGYETIGDRRNNPPRVARRPPKSPLCHVVTSPPKGRKFPATVGEKERFKRPDAFGEVGPLCHVVTSPPRGRKFPEAVGEKERSKLPETFGEVVEGLPEKLGRRIFREVSQVWEVALEELYQGAWIAETERERAKARLAEYYIFADPKRYAAGTAEICERIRLVRKWMERGAKQGQERWVPIPSVYFDHRNPRGFGRTKEWFKKHRAKRREIGDNIAVARAVRRYQRCLKNSNGAQGPMEMYQQLVGQLEERGDGVVERFCEAVG